VMWERRWEGVGWVMKTFENRERFANVKIMLKTNFVSNVVCT
jgi:hypothetical protein